MSIEARGGLADAIGGEGPGLHKYRNQDGWVVYFRVGNSAEVLQQVKYQVERKVRRFAARKSKRGGFGWKRWSSDVMYGAWGLFDDYQVRYLDLAKVGLQPKGIISSVR